LISVSTASTDANQTNNSVALALTAVNPAPNIVLGGAALLTEGFAPPNGTIDSGETVTVLLTLTNSGNADTASVVATLLATNGVTPLSGPQNYGALLHGGVSGANQYTFVASGANGGTVAAVLQLQEDMRLVGEAQTGAEGVARFRELRPDVTLMDLQMPGMSGVQAIEAIRSEAPNAKIVVLTTYDGDAQALRALRAGAAGYLLKSSLRKELIETIRTVHAGRKHVSTAMAERMAVHAVDERLSEREIAILRLVADGNQNKQIAWKLSISEETVKAHLKSIFGKLDVSDRTDAVTVAVRRGIIDL